jgi:hypothetical protein
MSVIFVNDPACSFHRLGMSIVARKVKAAFGRPVVVLGLMLLAFVALQCCLPLATAVKIGADEDYELSKAVLCLNGHHLYTEVWSDQPPLYVSLLTVILKHLYMANCHLSSDWQFKQSVAVALPAVILKAGGLRGWVARFLPGRVAG